MPWRKKIHFKLVAATDAAQSVSRFTKLFQFSQMEWRMRLLPHFLGLVLGISSITTQFAQAQDITGAGSSAAKPLYTKWAEMYNQRNKIKLTYQATGSADGIAQAKAKSVDFGASDLPLSQDELKKERLINFPSAISGVVPVVNLPDVKNGELRLTGEILADIFARKIVKWQDPAIVALNPGLNLPKLDISLVVRQDGSGTTYNFTDYLSLVSPSWKTTFGRNLSIKWPADAQQVKGSADLVAALKQKLGAISYVDFKYVTQDKLNFAQLKNRDGKFVAPSARAFAVALNGSGWRSNGSFEESLANRPGVQTWPITAGTFIVLPQMSKNPANTIAMLKFFSWAFMKGDHLADGSDFVALPDVVQARIFVELLKVTDSKGKALEWTPI